MPYPWIQKQRNQQQLKKERESYYKDRDRFQRFYQSADWQRLRSYVLASNPICAVCRKDVATECDHIVPLAENYNLRLTLSNLQGLCKSCHSKKTIQDTKNKNDAIREERIDDAMNDLNDYD